LLERKFKEGGFLIEISIFLNGVSPFFLLLHFPLQIFVEIISIKFSKIVDFFPTILAQKISRDIRNLIYFFSTIQASCHQLSHNFELFIVFGWVSIGNGGVL